MTRTELHPFAEEHLAAAGRLLAQRHRHHRAAEPLLPEDFEDPAAATAALADELGAAEASGAVATRGGDVVGYLLGAAKPSPTWGPNVWVESAGHAVDTDLPDHERTDLARELYAEAATRWVDEGRTAHYALLPAHDTALASAWFRLAFGHQHTHAVQSPPADVPPPRDGLVVRRPTRDDIPALATLENVLPRHQGLAPCFSSGPLGSYEESVAEWTEDFDDPTFTTFVVEHEGRVVGSAVGCPLEKSSSHTGPARPEHAAFLGFAAVLPEARGLGAGRAVGDAVGAWAHGAGYTSLVTDWRETNLLSSRAWRRLGYRDTFTRVHRLVGH
ncbi:GNAT family N-acetyltransferase [Nocardioides sp. KIGAM211]|uniref:GNAT family N-acetyltransferase n=1 Tax=Nocardioides luti TaxID=2761101 RepID=A0A7X0RIM2_9ACTN|nr:GNAT family N-acetyltransferase [Nocardioides luti]MBB6627995.1 GNAT family N-acetyltransferase [Nocardioides luti]